MPWDRPRPFSKVASHKEMASKVGITRQKSPRSSLCSRTMTIFFLRRYFYSRLAIGRVISYARARKGRGIEYCFTREA